MACEKDIGESIKSIYRELASDTRACCLRYAGGADQVEQARYLGYSEEEIRNIPKEAMMGLGCANPLAFPGIREGQRVLDLGSGAGMDAFLAAHKVGQEGKVIGIDMTEEMVKKAQNIAKRHGYTNIEFKVGAIENLPVEDGSIDFVISNCVINLSSDKERAFREAYRILKPDGKALIADMVAEGKLSDYEVWCYKAWTGCSTDLIQKADYLGIMRKAGFKEITVLNEVPFHKFGLSVHSEGEIKGIQVVAFKQADGKKEDFQR